MASVSRVMLPARALRPVRGATYLRGPRASQFRGYAAEAPKPTPSTGPAGPSANVGGASASAGSGGSSGALVGGLAGGLAVVALGYGWYHFSGTKAIVNKAHETKNYIDSAFRGQGLNAPKPNEAIQWLRSTVESYSKFIPGAQSYVETAFDDIEQVQKNHAGEVDKIVNDTYSELKDVTKAGASVAAAYQAWEVIQKALKRIGSLAGDAAGDIMKQHPELKEKIGGQYKQLQSMGESLGPDAKKQVEDTYKQVQDIIKEGLNGDSIKKVQKLVQDKAGELQKKGDEIWKQGLSKLEKSNPELKKQLEQNKDKLMQGDIGKLWQQLQEAAKSGNTDDLQKFVSDQVEKGKQGGSHGIEQLFGMIPGGKDVGSKFQQLQELSQKHGKDAEKLVKSAFEDVKKVLEKKVEEGQALKEKAEKDAKS